MASPTNFEGLAEKARQHRAPLAAVVLFCGTLALLHNSGSSSGGNASAAYPDERLQQRRSTERIPVEIRAGEATPAPVPAAGLQSLPLRQEGRVLPKRQVVLVTGGAGFIGSHVAASMKERGDTVVVLDIFNDYYAIELKEARAQNLTEKGIKVIKGDVCDAELLETLFVQYKFTAVIHLAAQAGVRFSIAEPLKYVRANVECFVTLLEVIKSLPSTTFVYASSSSVYGSKARIPFSLNDPVDHQTNVYGATKRADELLARAYHHLYNISVTGLRFFTVYGEWGRPDMAPYVFTERVSKGETIDVYGHGQMRRDFTYVSDIVNGIILATDHGAGDELFNVGNGKSVVLDDFIAVVEQAVGRTAVKNMLPRNHAELPVTFSDTSHTTEVLGYHSTVGIDEGVPRFVAWYKWYTSRSQAEIAAAHSLVDTYTL